MTDRQYEALGARGPTGGDEKRSWANAGIERVAAPLRDQVFGVVRKAILDFELLPGERLIERELIQNIGVSRTTVREVLARLAAEGLVTIVPQKGAVVSVLSVEEAADIYEMRAALEGLAVERFIERATDREVRELREALNEVKRASELAEGQLEAKDRFYEVLLAGAKSPPLTQMLTSLQGRVRLLRALSLSMPGRPKEAAAEIERVVEAVEAGDVPTATQLCAEHVRKAAAIGLARLASRQAASADGLRDDTGAATEHPRQTARRAAGVRAQASA